MLRVKLELSDRELAFVKRAAAAGGFASPSDYVVSLVEAERLREEELNDIRPDYCIGRKADNDTSSN